MGVHIKLGKQERRKEVIPKTADTVVVAYFLVQALLIFLVFNRITCVPGGPCSPLAPRSP